MEKANAATQQASNAAAGAAVTVDDDDDDFRCGTPHASAPVTARHTLFTLAPITLRFVEVCSCIAERCCGCPQVSAG